MSDPLYRIKPLVWKKNGEAYEGSHPLLRISYYWVDRIAEIGKWRWGLYPFSGICIAGKKGFETREAAQAAADAHNAETMLPGLEEVEPIGFNGTCDKCNGPLVCLLNGLWCETCRVETSYKERINET